MKAVSEVYRVAVNRAQEEARISAVFHHGGHKFCWSASYYVSRAIMVSVPAEQPKYHQLESNKQLC